MEWRLREGMRAKAKKVRKASPAPTDAETEAAARTIIEILGDRPQTWKAEVARQILSFLEQEPEREAARKAEAVS